MERLSASWEASGVIYNERLAKNLLPRFNYESLLSFLDPHNLPSIAVANVAYLLVVFAIVRLVKSNGSMSDRIMKPFMLFYNASCVVLAGAVVFGIVQYKLTVKLGTFACNSPDLGTPAGETLAWYIWLYYAQKFWEYLDTVIFAMRGSFRQLSFLHVYHHVSITFVTSAFLRHDVNGDCYAAALANSFIHVLMYSHYFCSAVGVNTWYTHTHTHTHTHNLLTPALHMQPPLSLFAICSGGASTSRPASSSSFLPSSRRRSSCGSPAQNVAIPTGPRR